MNRCLLDTNLLLLLVVGSVHPDWIGSRKPVSNFVPEELGILEGMLAGVATFVTTPHILTEASNQIGSERRNSASAEVIRRFKSFAINSEELFCPAADIVSKPEFARFGLTDSAILHLARANTKVLTNDHDLFGALSYLGMRVENTKHQVSL